MSRVRVAALLLVAAALGLRIVATASLRDQRSSAAAESRRMLDQARVTRARLLEIERRNLALRRAMSSTAPGVSRIPVAATRTAVLACLEGGRLSGVRLEVRAGPPPAAASVQLSAEGSFHDVVRLTRRLVESRIVFSQVRVSASERGLALALDGLTLASGS